MKNFDEETQKDALDEDDIRREEREKCCRDVCECCKRGREVARREHQNGTWWHEFVNDLDEECDAMEIRERAYREEGGQ